MRWEEVDRNNTNKQNEALKGRRGRGGKRRRKKEREGREYHYERGRGGRNAIVGGRQRNLFREQPSSLNQISDLSQ